MPEHSTNLDHTPPLTPTSESKIRPVWVRQRARSLGILGVLGVLGRLPAIGELVSIPYGPVWQQQRADLTEFSDFLRRRLHRPKRREEREAAKATAARVVVGRLFTLSSLLPLLLLYCRLLLLRPTLSVSLTLSRGLVTCVGFLRLVGGGRDRSLAPRARHPILPAPCCMCKVRRLGGCIVRVTRVYRHGHRRRRW